MSKDDFLQQWLEANEKCVTMALEKDSVNELKSIIMLMRDHNNRIIKELR